MRNMGKKVIDFIVICINEFAKQCNLSSRDAYFYLKEHKGIEFLKVNYEAEHMIGLDDVIDDLKQICNKNGGDIK